VLVTLVQLAAHYQEAVAALAEVVALDECTEHEDLASDRAALEQARRMVALSPEERAALAAEAEVSQMQALAEQVSDAAIVARRGLGASDTGLPGQRQAHLYNAVLPGEEPTVWANWPGMLNSEAATAALRAR
jgi:hypothetical protein